MKKLMIISLLAVVSVLSASAQTSIYDFKVKDDAGKDVSLSDYKGKVLLIVNTATMWIHSSVQGTGGAISEVPQRGSGDP